MIFSIQRFLEDRFHRRGLTDVDQFAVSLANFYDSHRQGRTQEEFSRAARRLHTAFFRNNRELRRDEFVLDLVRQLDRRFKKQIATGATSYSSVTSSKVAAICARFRA
jgi:hypothetical protein